MVTINCSESKAVSTSRDRATGHEVSSKARIG